MFSQTVGLGLSQKPGWLAHLALAFRFRLVSLQRAMPLSIPKYVLDLLLCVLLMPLALLIMGVITLAILGDSGRPVLFVQERIGRGGRRFRMFKFRTLRKDHSDRNDRKEMRAYIQGHPNRSHDLDKPTIHKPFERSHVTRVGRILRKTSLDELPQLFNVLRGEMSLVGPRPNVTWEVEVYRLWHTERLEVLPGITGLAQVRGRSGLAWDQLARYDIEYVRSRCLLLDLKILCWTMASILSGRGAG
jgi:lipopolysaccharide/colanic/teichoic acid biosynthesis glycosyltransferase